MVTGIVSEVVSVSFPLRDNMVVSIDKWVYIISEEKVSP